MEDGCARTKAQKVILLFVESGVLYCILWVSHSAQYDSPSSLIMVKTSLVAYSIAVWVPHKQLDLKPELPGHTQKFIIAMDILKTSCLIDIIVRLSMTRICSLITEKHTL